MRQFFISALSLIAASVTGLYANSQTLEWRLANLTYSNTDPDGAGPATGTASFTLQVHTTSGSVSNITGMSTGWAWQSAAAMVPTGAPCGTNSTSQPSNITMSSAFGSIGFSYNNVNECSGTVNFTTGGQVFDRRSVGTVDGGNITIGTAWTDVFTATLWSLGTNYPQAGYVVINSGAGGAPGEFSTYSIADDQSNEFVANSLTYSTPLALGAALPVVFSSFNVACQNREAVISWTTETEINSSHFIIQKSIDGGNWTDLRNIPAAGNSSVRKNYSVRVNQNGNAMYRLKQVDVNGAFLYSTIQATDCGSFTASSAFPVPARDVVHVAVQAGVSQKVTIQLTDATGRKVRTQSGQVSAGSNYFDLNVSGLPPGYYTLQVIRELEGTENISVIKQ